jgi:sugar lactone lactonase YvrE
MKSKIYLFLGFLSLVSFSADAQMISTVVGSSGAGFSGDGGAASAAKLHAPAGVALDAGGNLYIADQYNHAIRRVNTAGVITTVVGDDTAGFSGDGGPAVQARLNKPSCVTIDGAGNIYIADKGNHKIRKINTAGIISTIAGTGVPGYSGENDTAIHAQLNNPTGVAVDSAGNVFIADQLNNRIRVINSAGIIYTLVGTGVPEYNGDFFPLLSMIAVNKPGGVAISPSGELHIVDTYNNRIRKIDKVTGKIVSIDARYTHTPYTFTYMQLHWPSAIAFDKVGNMYVADEYYYQIKKRDSAGIYYRMAGTTSGYSGDGGRGDEAQMSQVKGIAADAAGNIYVADWGNDRIRFVTTTVGTETFRSTTQPGVTIYPNPSQSGQFTVNITATGNEKVDIVVTDISGRTVYTGATETNKPMTVALQQPAGVYMLTASVNGETISEKIVIE